MYILQDELKLIVWQFSLRKYLPYEIKVKLAEARIREWYENWYGEVYLSYSGGMDSTALLYMIRKVLGMRYQLYFRTQAWNSQKLYGTHVRQVVTM